MNGNSLNRIEVTGAGIFFNVLRVLCHKPTGCFAE